mmetsp:Transcript_11813/g.27197  ORF Transcript_11813/g.27197 Transcript_11813/m.27197 type:complete len:735 (-) Transcript_11813:86-2290(-)
MSRLGRQQLPVSLLQTSWDEFLLFRNLSTEEVNDCISRMKVRTFKPGEQILKQGSIGTTVHFIDVGKVKVVHDGLALSELRTGNMFGEISFVGMCKKIMKRSHGSTTIERTCSIEAVEITRTLEISVQDFLSSLNFDNSGDDAILRALECCEELIAVRSKNIQHAFEDKEESAPGLHEPLDSPGTTMDEPSGPMLEARKQQSLEYSAMDRAMAARRALRAARDEGKEEKSSEVVRRMTILAAMSLFCRQQKSSSAGSAPTAVRFSEKYRMGKRIGDGAFSTVKECVSRRDGKKYAVKILSEKNSLYKHEIKALRNASHPNCVTMIDVFEEDRTYLVLELLSGGTVLDRIVESEFFSENDAILVTRSILKALEYLHSQGIVHRDIKPENLLYVSNDPSSPFYHTVKVSDFGFSKHDCQVLKTACGTPEYMAPEVLETRASGYDEKVDVWSLGIVVYVMLSGFFPFLSSSRPALFKKIAAGEFSFPSPYWDCVSDKAKDFISKTLKVKPEERTSAAAALQHPWMTEGVSLCETKLHGLHRAFMLIRKLPLFDSVDPSCLQEVIKSLKTVRVEQGQFVIRCGDVGDSMYFVNSGSVKIMLNGEEIDRLSTGDFFGEVALMLSEKRIADVISLGSSREVKVKKTLSFPEPKPQLIVEHISVKGARSSSTDCSACWDESRAKKEQDDEEGRPVELFQLMRTDFESIMSKFPMLRTRLASIGRARVRRKDNFVLNNSNDE